MRVELDWALMTGRKEVHEYLKQQFQFPDYYGRNLDALYDLLSSAETGYEITFVNGHLVEANLGGYGSALLATIKEAAEDNPKILIKDIDSGVC